jgi:hypothetical protein
MVMGAFVVTSCKDIKTGQKGEIALHEVSDDTSKKVICPSIEELSGSYESISESEWSVSLLIENDGIANVQLVKWDAGKYEQRNITKMTGAWAIKCQLITIVYEGIKDEFVFSKSVSLEKIGLDKSSPGLVQSKPYDSRSLVSGATLWKKPHDFFE